MSSCDCLSPLVEDISRMSLFELNSSQDFSDSSDSADQGLEPEDHPLYIDCVLLNCFKYLSVKTLGTCRLVSKFWNQAACSSLRQRSVVTFKFAEEIYGFTNVMESCKDSPYQRFILRIFEHEIEHSLVKHFFETFGSSVTSLTFDFQGNSRYAFKPPDPKVFQSLLQKTRKLQELKLYGVPDNILCEPNLFITSDFPQLKSFSFSIYQDSYGRTTPDEFQRQEDEFESHSLSQNQSQCQIRTRRALIFNIMECVRNLRKLEVGSVNGECVLKILQDINLQQLEAYTSLALNVSPFRSESLVQLGMSCPNLSFFSCFLDLSTTPEQIHEILSNMPNLKYLKLQGGYNVSDLPCMKKVQEVHLLIPCTLQIEQLMEKFPDAGTLNIVLSRSSFLACSSSSSFNYSNGFNPCPSPSDGSPVCDGHPSGSGSDNNSGALSENLTSLQGTLRGCLRNDGHCVSMFLKNIKYRFPMLSRLRLPVTSETLISIFRYFTNLQELHIEDGSLISDEVITGISSDDLYLDSFEIQDETTCSVSRTRPYIGDLKCLQRLFVGSTSITNASVYYGFGDLHELTSISLREPLEIIIGSNYEHLKIAGHYFSLYPLIRQLPNLVRVEVRESRFRSHRNEHPAILPVEIEHVKRLRPHLQIVYVCLRSERGDEKVVLY